MTQTDMARGKLFAQVLDSANRANPYPLYARLRETPVALQEDGIYVVSTYREIVALLQDPRIRSLDADRPHRAGELAAFDKPAPQGRTSTSPITFFDPHDHDRLRRLVLQQLSPQRVEGMRDQVVGLVNSQLDAQRNRSQLDIVDDFAYPLPLSMICQLLGVPREDEPRLQAWTTVLARSFEPAQGMRETEVQQQAAQADREMTTYMNDLIAARRTQPGDDLLSGLVAGSDPDGKMNEQELLSTVLMLLVAGHESTVNLIANGMLTLLRHPDVLERLRRDKGVVINTVEEVLRYEPPVQFRPRTPLTDVQVAGVTLPKGATVVLLFAAGSRDPARFPEPERFDPERADNEHLGFGDGIHSCIGAPLVRVEAQVALSTLARRLLNPRLVADPPPYREDPSLRGPEHLLVAFDRLLD
jgi:cytochrome P450